MEKLDLYIKTKEPELIKMWESMTYEEKISMYQLEEEGFKDVTVSTFTRKLVKDMLEEKGVDRELWVCFRIKVRDEQEQVQM